MDSLITYVTWLPFYVVFVKLTKKEGTGVICGTEWFAINCVLYVFYSYSCYCHYANIILKHIWKANTILLSYISDYLTELSQMPFLPFSNEWGEVMRIPAERMALLLALFTKCPPILPKGTGEVA